MLQSNADLSGTVLVLDKRQTQHGFYTLVAQLDTIFVSCIRGHRDREVATHDIRSV